MTEILSAQQLSESLLAEVYRPVSQELADVERVLRDQLRSEHPSVDELVRYGCLLGGKRLRPALLLLAAKACGDVRPAHVTLGAVVEMVHTSTLIHDDVLDDATTRRHLATVNALWDNTASVLLGDFLYTRAFHLASTVGDVFACREIGSAANAVCEGELRQKGTRGNFRLSEQEYLSLIDAKTAALCACSCLLGAHYAGATDTVERRLTAYGRNLGIAFQIADDVLDVVGDEAAAGTSLGTDLDQLIPTLPLIRVLQVVGGDRRDAVLRSLERDPRERRAALAPYLTQCGAIEYARDKALQFAHLAQQQLEDLVPSPAVTSLDRLTHLVVDRTA